MLISEKDLSAIQVLYDLGEIKDKRALDSGFQSDNCYIDTHFGKFVLRRIYLTRDEVKRIMQLHEFLALNDIKTPYPLRAKNDRICVQLNDHVFAIQSFIPGAPKSSKNEVYALLDFYGRELGRIHYTLNILNFTTFCDLKPKFGLDSISYVQNLAQYLPDDDYLQKSYQQWEQDIAAIPLSKLTMAVTHGDCGHKDFFFHNDKYTGVLDFGAASYNYLLFDVATMIMYTELYKRENSPEYRKFIRAYVSESPIAVKELEFLHFFVKTRFMLQVVFFAMRLATEHEQGVDNKEENMKGLEDGKRFLKLLETLPQDYFYSQSFADSLQNVKVDH